MKRRSEELVVTATYTFLWEARLARTRLEEAGIESLVEDPNTVSFINIHIPFARGFTVKVFESDASRAKKILKSSPGGGNEENSGPTES